MVKRASCSCSRIQKFEYELLHFGTLGHKSIFSAIMMLAGAQEILKKARRRAPPPGPESYRSLFIVGLLFPLHILLGLAAVPLALVAPPDESLVAALLTA